MVRPRLGSPLGTAREAMHISSIRMTYARFVCTYVCIPYVHTHTYIHTHTNTTPPYPSTSLPPSLAKPTPPAPSLRSDPFPPAKNLCHPPFPSMSRVGCCTAHWLAGSSWCRAGWRGAVGYVERGAARAGTNAGKWVVVLGTG